MSLYEEGRSVLKDINSRGIKQRLGKMLRKKFNIQSEENANTNKVEEAIQKNEEKVQQKNTKEEKRK